MNWTALSVLVEDFMGVLLTHLATWLGQGDQTNGRIDYSGDECGVKDAIGPNEEHPSEKGPNTEPVVLIAYSSQTFRSAGAP